MSKRIVYAVSSGSYSDYRVNGIFSTREKAEKFLGTCRASEACWNKDFNDIIEYTLDADLAQQDYVRYSVGIMCDTGEVKEGPRSKDYFGIPESKAYISYKVPLYQGRDIARSESHKSAAHAMKVAVEARQKWLREREARHEK